MEVMPMRHKRSMSDLTMRKDLQFCISSTFEPCYDSKLGMGLESCVEVNNRQSLDTEVQKTLKQEILQLQKQLEDQFLERSALEKALTNQPLPHAPMNKNSIPKHAEDLIKEISVLEFEVIYLEKYLLSLYRKRFQGGTSILSEADQSTKFESVTKKLNFSEFQDRDVLFNNEKSKKLPQNLVEKQSKELGEFSTLTDSCIHRSHSSLSHRFDRSLETIYHVGFQSEDVNPYHSMPLSMLEHAQGDYRNSNNLGEYLHKNTKDAKSETPNWISEEMIKSISSIYIELVEPSILSPVSDSSPNKWNLEEIIKSSSPSWIENSLTNSSVLEVKFIYRDNSRLKHVHQALQHFRSLVSRLEKIDLRRMKHEEKLAFWINVHNALVMHAYLVHGISQNSMRRISFILKAAYNVGGHAISIDMIQNSILGCRLPRPGQWLHSLLFPKTKFKIKDARRAYAIEYPEPRLYFALCCGNHSDPSVRIYSPKSIFQDLEASKEDYMQTNLTLNKQGKIILPKIVDLYAKESSLCPSELSELIEYLLPDSLRKKFQLQSQSGNFLKRINWVQHNFSFRFLLSKELLPGI